MANFQGNRINPTRFSTGQIKFHIIAFPLSIFMILPVIFIICQAFKPLGELFRFPPTIFVHNPTLDNFKNLFNLAGATGIPMSRYFLNSLIVTVLTVILNVIITIMAAYSAGIPMHYRSCFVNSNFNSLSLQPTHSITCIKNNKEKLTFVNSVSISTLFCSITWGHSIEVLQKKSQDNQKV